MTSSVFKLTVFFEDPFWVGVCEREQQGCYSACKITFGAEPKDYEVYDFLLKNWHRLRFGPLIKGSGIRNQQVNPKRMQREVKKQLLNTGAGTKAQQALKLQQEQGREERKRKNKEQRDAEKQYKFCLQRKKRKEKHKGH